MAEGRDSGPVNQPESSSSPTPSSSGWFVGETPISSPPPSAYPNHNPGSSSKGISGSSGASAQYGYAGNQDGKPNNSAVHPSAASSSTPPPITASRSSADINNTPAAPTGNAGSSVKAAAPAATATPAASGTAAEGAGSNKGLVKTLHKVTSQLVSFLELLMMHTLSTRVC